MKRIKDFNNRVTLVDLYSVGCSDWHHTWGMGTNKIGRLYYEPTDDIYIWRGHCQGRHGQKWNEHSEYHFKIVEGKKEEVWTNKNKSILPTRGELDKSILQLETLLRNDRA